MIYFRKKKTTTHRISTTKYEKFIMLIVYSLQNNYKKLEIRKENIYTTSYEISQSQFRK